MKKQVPQNIERYRINLFWEKDETVVHYFPKESEYVNRHPYTLHLWRCQSSEYVLPPKEYVG